MSATRSENINSWLAQISDSAKAAISVDCVIFGHDNNGLNVLTIESNMPPYEKMRSLVGDLILTEETLDQAATRILEERIGIKGLYLEQVKAFDQPRRHPLGRVISVAYYTIVNVDEYKVTDDTAIKPRWIPVKELDEMAFDHMNILNDCLYALRERVHSHPVLINLLNEKFTIVELQAIYEDILGCELDRRNFSRKVKKLPYILDLKILQQEVNHRPAKLFAFNHEKYERHIAKNKVNFNL